MIKVNFIVKQLGKRKPSLEPQVLVLPDLRNPCSLEELVFAVVAQQVEAFHLRLSDSVLMPFLTDGQIMRQKAHGKIDFGEKINPKYANLENAKQATKLAYKDGLYKVFQNQDEINSWDQTLHLQPSDTFTLIRLTFLTGN